MRAMAAMLAVLVLCGCDSGTVPSPAERQAAGVAAGETEAGVVELRSGGLAAGPEAFFFAAGQKEVEAALTRVLGASSGGGRNGECGAGPMDFTEFPGGLTAHFQDGRLVGWNWHDAPDGAASASGTVRLAGEVQLGAPRESAAAVPGFAPVEGSTLGEEFALGDAVGGFVEDGRVAMLYAGTQCFFR